jgi:uncharacterized repeat protein (TIGR01451 family)
MYHRSDCPRRRTRLAFAGLLTSLVLALTFGAFASVAAASDESPSGGGVSADSVATPDPTPSANNPAPDKCGLNIALIVDRSGSTDDFDSDYKNATAAFVNGLAGTPSQIGIVTFASGATLRTTSGNHYVDISSVSAATTLANSITASPSLLGSTGGNTNWQDALATTTSSFTSPEPDLAVFITDGNPTTQNGGFASDLGAGMSAANALKADTIGTHITGVAVGANIDLANIGKITGTGSVIGTSDLPGYDVHQPADPAALAATLKALATDLCGGSVTIHKTIKVGPAPLDAVNSPNWTFSNGDGVSGITDANGLTNLKLPAGTATLTESGLAGYTIQSVTCGDKTVSNVTGNSFQIDVGNLDVISCNVVNTPALSTIAVNKVTTHGVGGPFALQVTGSNGVSPLSVSTVAKNTATLAGTVGGLYPGDYTVSETDSPDGWTATGISCTGAETTSISDSSITVHVVPGSSVTCTQTNDEVPSDLSIVKAVTRGPIAVNGDADQQIDYSLTVDNHGPADAHVAATVTDVLPSGATFVSVSAPTGVDCDTSSLPAITCTIPADQLEVADDAVVISVSATVPTGSGTAVNQSVVTSPDDPSGCTVGDLVISCPPGSNNFSEVSTDIPAVEAAVVTQTPATPTAARVEAAQALAFTGSNDTMPVAALGALSVAGGAVLLVLARRRRGTAS